MAGITEDNVRDLAHRYSVEWGEEMSPDAIEIVESKDNDFVKEYEASYPTLDPPRKLRFRYYKSHDRLMVTILHGMENSESERC